MSSVAFAHTLLDATPTPREVSASEHPTQGEHPGLTEMLETAMVSGALRRHLAAHGSLPAEPMIAAVPVSLRDAGNTEATTLATMRRMGLATDVEDALARLQAIGAGSVRTKSLARELRSIIPAGFLSVGMPWLFIGAATLYGRARLADRIPPLANLVVSNFPGPTTPLYLAGARLLTWWPLSIVEHGLGLNVTVQSYAGSLDFGVVAAQSALRDPAAFAGTMRESFDELQLLRKRRGRPR